jgi:hypothetical protein
VVTLTKSVLVNIAQVVQVCAVTGVVSGFWHTVWIARVHRVGDVRLERDRVPTNPGDTGSWRVGWAPISGVVTGPSCLSDHHGIGLGLTRRRAETVRPQPGPWQPTLQTLRRRRERRCPRTSRT